LNIGEQSINTQRQQQRNPRSLAQDMNPDWRYAHCPRKSAVSGSAIQIG
jgi:hypothetical protein